MEGKAGMAAIYDPKEDLDLSELAQGLRDRLPSFARPLFLRMLTKGMDITGTFKHKKFRFQTEGFDPKEVGQDRLFFLHPASGTYQELDQKLYQDIVTGTIRL